MQNISDERMKELRRYYQPMVDKGTIQGFFVASTPDPKVQKIIITAINKDGVPTEVVQRSCDHACGPSDFYKGGLCDRKGCYRSEAQIAYDAAVKRLDKAITHAKAVAESLRKQGRGGPLGYNHIQMRIERAQEILQTSADLIELASMAGELEGLNKGGGDE